MSRSTREGFTLVEVIVVIGIAVIVIGLFMPATRRVSGAAERTRCQNNLRQMMIAIQNYHDQGIPLSPGQLTGPKGHFIPTGCIGSSGVPEEQLSWIVSILPFLEQDVLFQQFNVHKGYAENSVATNTGLKALLCPAAKGASKLPAVTHYVAIAGVGRGAAAQPAGAAGNGFMGYDRLTTIKMIEDGTSNSIALFESRTGHGPWARGGTTNLRGLDPDDVPLIGEKQQFGGHRGGPIAALADCSTRTINPNISAKTLAAAMTIVGNETLGSDW